MSQWTFEDNATDAFDKLIADSTTNVLDLAAHYPYSPERWRVFVDGTRQLIQYGSVSQYNHAGDYHELKPAAGETVTMESAERPRYVVQYELAATWAFAVNQSLQSGDSIRVGLYDGSDGWYMEHKGSHDDAEADFVLERSGSEVYRREDIDIQRTVLDNARLLLQTGWYDITGQKYERSYHDGDEQVNVELLNTSKPKGKRGSKTGNLPLHYSVTASASTTGLILEAGSAAQVNLGKTTPFVRNKVAIETATIGSSGTWVPLFALRIDPDRDITNVQLADVAIIENNTGGDTRVLAQSCAPSKVLDASGNQLTDADFSTPEGFGSQNSVIEVSTAVAQFPDSTGSPTTSTSNPGGFQVGFGASYTSQGQSVTNNLATGQDVKRPMYGRDVVVFPGYSGATGDVSIQYSVEEDW